MPCKVFKNFNQVCDVAEHSLLGLMYSRAAQLSIHLYYGYSKTI